MQQSGNTMLDSRFIRTENTENSQDSKKGRK